MGPASQGETDGGTISARIDAVYRAESRRVLATLIRVLGGDFDLAEEALHEAFVAAAERWPVEGVPGNPRAWLVSAGRFKAIDVIRRRAAFDASMGEVAERLGREEAGDVADMVAERVEGIEDDRLRLVFTCCHPALAPEARVALTLREVCGLTTEEIARAFLVSPATIAQRIVRAKGKIKAARIPYQVPSRMDMPERVEGVLLVVYLVFSEGYSASAGEAVTRAELSGEAIRLGRVLAELLPGETEVVGLLALMLLQESRRAARTSAAGDMVLLEDQDRALWDRATIDEGVRLVARAMRMDRAGPFTLQAAIAAEHSRAVSARETDWGKIAELYDLLLRMQPSPVVELNRAVAVAMRDGPGAGIAIIDAILRRGDLTAYHYAHAARADLCRRLGRRAEARDSYHKALELAQQEPERRFLRQRLSEVTETV